MTSSLLCSRGEHRPEGGGGEVKREREKGWALMEGREEGEVKRALMDILKSCSHTNQIGALIYPGKDSWTTLCEGSK